MGKQCVNKQCSLYKVANEIDLSLTNAAIGRKYRVSKDAVRRHRRHIEDIPDDFFGVPTEAITSRGKSVRLADGSWEKIMWQPNKVALAESLTYDDIEKAIKGYKAQRVVGKPGRHTGTIHAADLQIGKAGQRGGGTPETIQRVRESFEKARLHFLHTKPECIILSDNGDPIENIFNVSGQRYTNDLDVPMQIRTFRRLMIEGIKILAPLAPRFVYLTVPSNHGEFRVGYKEQGGNADADFGLEISHQLEDVFREHENSTLRDIEFIRPDSLEQTAVIETSGTRLAYHHGHAAAKQAGLKDWWARLDHGRRPGWDADIFVTAHFHNLRLEQSGDGRWLIGVSSSEPSSDWYTNGSGETAKRGMTMFDTRDGEWFNLGIV